MQSDDKNINNDFGPVLVKWFEQRGRQSLPWQKNRNSYNTWVSEIMLQQTQVETVIPYYQKFLSRFPGIDVLADATLDDVMSCWAGLGYYARARNLHRAAQLIRDQHKGQFPKAFDDVLALPGIGRSTAGAILAFSRGARYPILDGNVKRVLARYFAIAGYPGHKNVENRLWELAGELTPEKNIPGYTQAIMDLGATVCVRNQPDCTVCPLQDGCLAFKHGKQAAYPSPKPKSKRPLRQSRMLLLQNVHREYLLVKRPPSGIWGGLWVFPELTDASIDYIEWCYNELGLTVEPGKNLKKLNHSFTHFELEIQPIVLAAKQSNGRVMDADHYLWYNPISKNPVGMPSAVLKILNLVN